MDDVKTDTHGQSTTDAAPAAVERAARAPKKAKRQVPRGNVYVHASFNNTIITIADVKGDVIAWASAGTCGFRGPKKATPYAAGIVVREAVKKLEGTGMREASVFIRGIGSGRESAVRALHVNGIQVIHISDVTPIPHNGCRPPKPRRI